MKKKEIIDLIAEKEDTYFDLVWYARKTPDQFDISKVKENMERIEETYPELVSSLLEDESSWEHGFNSGILAGMRYVLSLYSDGKEIAEEEFPFLDT